jgi:predicted Ser/Thr protein kinase
MLPCHSCSTEIASASRFCPHCGAPVAELAFTAAATVAVPPPHSSPSSSGIDEGRFPAGTLLAERYRILGLLGRGGMGEVYRAIDMKLGQPVALKFLPESTAHNERMLARMHAEVRLARQVSHPNVCRVYDVGEADGLVFLTMEYVDGEDLGSLLRRIGRLPVDKGVEVARRICAGLAAAHDKGVLHRDLKPANIMIDGRGQVLLTDFGLAGLAGQVEGAEIRNGTPAYMAPEQLAGSEVSARSDIYSLGLVLYEMFSGKRAFDGNRRTALASLATLVKDIDPAVERVVARCLEEDPRSRPSSALAVAAALPGGDPLAAALAAGETPSPEMVAAAGETDSIPVRTAVVCLAVIIIGIAAGAALHPHVNPLERTPFEFPPEALAQKAGDLIRSFGYTEKPADTYYTFVVDRDLSNQAARETKEVFRAQLASAQPPLVYFGYRQSPSLLEPLGPVAQPTRRDPPPILPGMIDIELDGLGRLWRFDAVPQGEPRAPSAAAFDWNAVFAATSLDVGRFSAAAPERLPLVPFDARAAWNGTFAGTPRIPVHIEAAAWQGKLVHFQIVMPWTPAPRAVSNSDSAASRVVSGTFLTLTAVLFVTACWLARRNAERGRGDLTGASRVGGLVCACSFGNWVLSAKHSATFGEFDRAVWALGFALISGATCWVLYVALEPYARRRWPQSLIAWTRLLSGRVRDPMVAGHILIGIAATMGTLPILYSTSFLSDATSTSVAPLGGARYVLATVVGVAPASILFCLFFFFFIFVMRVVLRRQWLAATVVLLLCGVLAFGAPAQHPAVAVLVMILFFGVWLVILFRYGLLCMAASWVVGNLTEIPFTTNFSAWWAGYGAVPVVLTLGLAIWAFRTAVAGRPLLREELLEG